MHSSRMRTGRTLTVFRSLLFRGEGTCLVRGGFWSWGGGGVWSWGGVPAWSKGGVCLVLGGVPAWSGGMSGPGGVYLPGRGGVPGQVPPPWTEFLTHACENITLAKTSFRPVIIIHSKSVLRAFYFACIYNSKTAMMPLFSAKTIS